MTEDEKDAIWARIDADWTYIEWCNDARCSFLALWVLSLASGLLASIVH